MTEKLDFSGLKLFQETKHHPSVLPGGRPAALLIHGFPGTPAEMGPLANLLNQHGWTTHNMLLPGFGSQIHTLFTREYQEWIEAASTALGNIQQEHAPTLLIGYSMGGSVAINVAAENRPSGLILLAPFWRFSGLRQRLVWQVFKRVTSSFRPFRRVSFDDPGVRQRIGELLPDLKVDDPVIQQALRELRVPNRIIEQIERMGRKAGKAASKIDAQLLLLQGILDHRVPVDSSRILVERLSGPFRYEEIVAGHDLVSDENQAWPNLSRSILRFARDLMDEQIA